MIDCIRDDDGWRIEDSGPVDVGDFTVVVMGWDDPIAIGWGDDDKYADLFIGGERMMDDVDNAATYMDDPGDDRFTLISRAELADMLDDYASGRPVRNPKASWSHIDPTAKIDVVDTSEPNDDEGWATIRAAMGRLAAALRGV